MLLISPVIYDYWGNVARTLLMTPLLHPKRAELREVWLRTRLEILGVGILSPLAYILILFALRSAPVTAAAPAREISIVFGAILGVRLFGEPAGGRRVVAALLMFAGIVGIAA